MKFELEPDNRGAEDETLLEDLRRVAHDLRKDSLLMKEYDRLGRFHSATVINRFGSWNKALELSGLRVRNLRGPHVRTACLREDELVADVLRVANHLNKSVLTLSEYKRFGRFSTTSFDRVPGGWPATIRKAGLSLSAKYYERLSDDQLFQNLEAVWRTIGKQPRGEHDMRPPLSRFGYSRYTQRFGGWRKALEAFVKYANRDETADDLATPPTTVNQLNDSVVSNAAQLVGRTPRSPSWRLRFLVMRRDNFKCRLCGASPSATPGVVLVLDHIVPWVRSRQTTFENLQTLCKPCNGGKSDLLIDGDELVLEGPNV